MRHVPPSVTDFLAARRIAVAGVSRTAGVGNAILDKLLGCGYDAVPVNPNASEIGGRRCYPSVAAVEGDVDAVVFASHPRHAVAVVRQCSERGVKRIWFHRSFGDGSVSEEAVAECRRLGIEPIVGGCPLMYCEPVDVAHRCMCWLLRHRGRVPAA
jgi:predicted CoA-binding protein